MCQLRGESAADAYCYRQRCVSVVNCSFRQGDANTVGTLTFDLETHSVKRRPIRLMQWRYGHAVTLASYNAVDGSDFKLA